MWNVCAELIQPLNEKIDPINSKNGIIYFSVCNNSPIFDDKM